MKKLSNTEAELKKSVAYEKSVLVVVVSSPLTVTKCKALKGNSVRFFFQFALRH